MIAFFIHIKKDVQNYSIILNSATLSTKNNLKHEPAKAGSETLKRSLKCCQKRMVKHEEMC